MTAARAFDGLAWFMVGVFAVTGASYLLERTWPRAVVHAYSNEPEEVLSETEKARIRAEAATAKAARIEKQIAYAKRCTGEWRGAVVMTHGEVFEESVVGCVLPSGAMPQAEWFNKSPGK